MILTSDKNGPRNYEISECPMVTRELTGWFAWLISSNADDKVKSFSDCGETVFPSHIVKMVCFSTFQSFPFAMLRLIASRGLGPLVLDITSLINSFFVIAIAYLRMAG